MNTASALSMISMFLTIGGIIGGLCAYRTAVNRTINEVQERVINALQQEIAVLKSKMERVEEENSRLDQIILTICEALKKRGLVITIDGNLVTISDGKDTCSARIQEV